MKSKIITSFEEAKKILNINKLIEENSDVFDKNGNYHFKTDIVNVIPNTNGSLNISKFDYTKKSDFCTATSDKL
jgi:hypothetical protein